MARTPEGKVKDACSRVLRELGGETLAVILAGVVKASGSFSDKGIADAVVKKLKAAIDGVGE